MPMTVKKIFKQRMKPFTIKPAARSKSWSYVLLVAFLFELGACSNTKYLPAGESLYTGADLKASGVKLSKKRRKAIETDLSLLVRPKPNANILGLRYKLWVYNITGNPKKKRSPAAWLKRKFGEPPVLLSDVNLDKNVQVLDNHLENQGYFQVAVKGDTVVKSRRATAKYSVNTNNRYVIKAVIWPNDSSDASKAIRSVAGTTLMRLGDPFDLDVIIAERLRIDAELKEKGFYYFNPDYLIIKADSTVGEDKVNMYVQFKRGTPDQSKRIFTINDVFVYSSYSLNGSAADTSKRNTTFYNGYYVLDRRNQYKPRMFGQALQFSPGDIYSRTDHNQSLNRLINLGTFKFVKNRFENVPGDSSKLNTYYYLTPLPKQSLHTELNGSVKSNNYTGTLVTVGWRNRNFFRSGELLTVNATGGFEVQYSGQFKGFNTYRVGLEAALSFPRYLIPFINLNTRSGFVPKTNIKAGYEVVSRQRLFTLNSFNTSFGYSWKESPLKEHNLNPISITYVQPINITNEYLDSIVRFPILKRTIDKQFILGTNYNYNYNQQVANPPVNSIYFNGNLDLSGNVAGLITGANSKRGDSVKFFNAPFAQYVRTEADLRYYRKLNPSRTVWANRIIAGIGLPYGNSLAMPYVKQFFVGGNNSLRAFRSRSVGPGTFADADTVNNKTKNTFYPDKTGDIKLEINTELRQKLFSIVQGALFIDAGNVWLLNENPDQPGGKFTKDFLSQLAVGAGAGLRVDATILVLRLDVAFPLRKPYLPAGERWVLDKIGLFDKKPDWRSQNLVFNLGIGYPF